MIWFLCKQCGKTHGRPESSAGTMVFCDCGQGLTVPWESTTTEPPPDFFLPTPPPTNVGMGVPQEEPEAVPLTGPKLEPMKFDTVPVQAPDSPPVPPRDRERPHARERPGRRRPDPRFCLNHSTVAPQTTCADCREALCGECLLTFQGESLCGPCKNFRVRGLDVPPRVSGFALTSLFMALLLGPLAFCLLPVGRSFGSPYLALGALLPQLAALVLGILALRDTEANPRIGGWSLALTGTLTAAVGCFLTILVSVFSGRLGV